MCSPESPAPELWEFPDDLLFRIVSFVAAPTFRAAVLCQQLAPLSRASYKNLLADGGEEKAQQRSVSLWDTVLREDYGVAVSTEHHARKKRRTCERLCRTPIERVRDAHRLMNSNTETAFFCLAELVRHNRSAEQRLTKARMIRIFEDYGPHLRLNRPVSSSGGVFLVEICRAKHVTERTVLLCVQELVERRGAAVDLRTCETARSRQTALCVAAVRGMASVTQYLLQRAGADPTIRSSGRFALHTNKKQSLRCDDATVVEFVQAMIQAEQGAGATKAALQGLTKCLRLLEKQQQLQLPIIESTNKKMTKCLLLQTKTQIWW